MLEKIDLSKKMSKNECKDLMERLTPQLSLLQREMPKRGVPVMIVFEGFGSSGKGTMINELIQPMDPRGFKVFTIQRPTREEAMHPYLWRFWTKLPENGRIHIFDRSWYTKIVEDRAEGRRNREKTENCYNNILDFEKELTQSGMLIIKFFLHISRKEQKKRFKVLESAEETRWRVTEDDWKHNRDYDEWLKAFEEMIQKTDTDFGSWTIIEATDREYAKAKILSKVVEIFGAWLSEAERKAKAEALSEEETQKIFGASVLDAVDLSRSLSKPFIRKS